MAAFKIGLALFLAAVCCGFSHGVPPYDGISATRGRVNNTLTTANKQMMTRSGHYARGNLTKIRVMLGNFYVIQQNNPVETGSGSAATVTASIEYPSGTCTQLLFSGVASVSIANLSTAVSDYLTLFIPNGSKFWVRVFFTNTTGIVYSSGAGSGMVLEDQAGMGHAMTVAASGLSDKTVDCTSVSDSAVGMHFPMAIISPIYQPSVCIFGDSIAWFQNDSYSGTSGDAASIARSIGPSYGYSNMAIGFDSAADFVGSHTQRIKIAPYCSSAIVEYGRNDFYDLGNSLAQLEAALTSIYGYFPSTMKGVYQTTLTPDTTSTDTWSTTTNQTVGAFETSMAAFNSALLANSFGPKSGALDVRSAVGTGTNNHFWQLYAACGGSTCTTDGAHPTHNSFVNIQTSGVIGAMK